MRSLLFLLAFLPFITHAQEMSQAEKDEIAKTNAALDVRSDGKLNFLSATKTFTQPAVKKDDQHKKLKEDVVHTGNVQFQVGNNAITCDSAVEYTNEGKVLAFNVRVTNPRSFTIKGGELDYDKEKANAVVSKDISVTALNGDLVGTSESFNLDFSYEVYRLNGTIKQPNDPSNKKK